jgi:acyl carrier protein
MSRDDVTAVLIDELGRIAPETDASELDPEADLREALDIDSMDFLNLVTALGQRLEIDIPEIDYPKLATLAGAVDYRRSCSALLPEGCRLRAHVLFRGGPLVAAGGDRGCDVIASIPGVTTPNRSRALDKIVDEPVIVERCAAKLLRKRPQSIGRKAVDVAAQLQVGEQDTDAGL